MMNEELNSAAIILSAAQSKYILLHVRVLKWMQCWWEILHFVQNNEINEEQNKWRTKNDEWRIKFSSRHFERSAVEICSIACPCICMNAVLMEGMNAVLIGDSSLRSEWQSIVWRNVSIQYDTVCGSEWRNELSFVFNSSFFVLHLLTFFVYFALRLYTYYTRVRVCEKMGMVQIAQICKFTF